MAQAVVQRRGVVATTASAQGSNAATFATVNTVLAVRVGRYLATLLVLV